MLKFTRFLSSLVLTVAFIIVIISIFLVGYARGYSFGKYDQFNLDQKELGKIVSSITIPAPTPKTEFVYITPQPVPKINWSGPQLWDVVNKRRVEFGVNPLKQKDELCTIASIRLNQLLELGKLDGHEGFSNLPTKRPDLKWIFDQYTISEFLVSGATSPQNAVSLWENTLGHKKLLSGGEYSFGCIYAQDGFAVAIAAY